MSTSSPRSCAPQPEALVDEVDAARARRHKIGVVGQPHDRAVVDHAARLGVEDHVAHAAELERDDAIREDAVEEALRVRARSPAACRASRRPSARRRCARRGFPPPRRRSGLAAARARSRPCARRRRRGGRAAASACPGRAAGRRTRPAASASTAAARSSRRAPPRRPRSPGRAGARTPAGTGAPGTGPSSRSCSAWRSRRRRTPRRPRGAGPWR